jgi:hypothetical protein
MKITEGTLISDITLTKYDWSDDPPSTEVPVTECKFIQVKHEKGYEVWRLFYTADSEGNGFRAVAVSFGSCPADFEAFGPDTEILDYIEFTAMFDGVRHLEVKRNDGEMAGYIYYPSDLTLLFGEVNGLIAEYCQKGSYDLL